MDNNNYDAKMELPQFVHVPIVMRKSESIEDGFIKTKARMNPFHISSYSASKYGESPCVCCIVGGTSYYVDMTIEEFDEMIGNIDRGLTLK